MTVSGHCMCMHGYDNNDFASTCIPCSITPVFVIGIDGNNRMEHIVDFSDLVMGANRLTFPGIPLDRPCSLRANSATAELLLWPCLLSLHCRQAVKLTGITTMICQLSPNIVLGPAVGDGCVPISQ